MEAVKTVVAVQRRRENTGEQLANAAARGMVKVGNGFYPADSIHSIEPAINNSFFLGMLGASKYGWIVHFFQRGDIRLGYETPDEAEAFLRYLRHMVPALQLIRREEVVFWWVSF